MNVKEEEPHHCTLRVPNNFPCGTNKKLKVMDLKEELVNLENVKDLLDSELIIDYVVPPLLLQLVSV